MHKFVSVYTHAETGICELRRSVIWRVMTANHGNQRTTLHQVPLTESTISHQPALLRLARFPFDASPGSAICVRQGP